MKRLRSSSGIAVALSEVRRQLETICDVEGVKELLEHFPECVLLGGISARRELVAALLGETKVAQAAAAVLVQPGMRQPIALELRRRRCDEMRSCRTQCTLAPYKKSGHQVPFSIGAKSVIRCRSSKDADACSC